MQPRDCGPWWADQHGTEWSGFGLWKATQTGHLERVLLADGVGARLYRRDGDVLHLVRIAPPDASADERRAFDHEFDGELATGFGDARDGR